MLRPRFTQAALLSIGIGSLFNADAQNESLEQVVVVGSRIAQPKDQAVAITVITDEQLQQRGYTTVQQALDDLPHNSGGGFDQQAGLSFTPAASGLNLRDMGVGRALVLLDGMRMPIYPLGWNGTDSFVDLSGIPAGAVERIEILPDGASAIYGSDAMSGVVNIVLKKRAANEVSLRYGDTTQGGGAEKRVQLSTGAQTDDANASLFVEYYHRSPLWYSQRERTRSDRLDGVTGPGRGDFSPYGYLGTFVNAANGQPTAIQPACDTSSGSSGVSASGYCLFNRSAYRQAWPDINSLTATAKFDQTINSAVSWFTLLNIRNAETVSQTEPLDFNSLDAGVVLPAGASNNPTGEDAYIQRRLVEWGPQRTQTDNLSYNAHAGLKGNFATDFDWQLALQASRLQLQTTKTGLILDDQMNAALNGQIDFNGDGINDPLDLSKVVPVTVAQQLEYKPVSLSQSSLVGADFQLTGVLFPMPAGRAKFAVAVEYFKESYFDHPDAQLIAHNVSYLSATAAQGQRGHGGVGVELQLPLLTQLQLNLAGRYDDYRDDSNVGGAFSPRIELKYRPSAAWLVRGSAGRSFRAPDLQRLYGGSSSGYQQFVNTKQCLADGGAGRGDTSHPSCVTPVYVGVTTGSSLQLQEERGNHYSAGVFWQPSTQWSASVDYFAMNLRQLVQTPDGQYVLDENAQSGRFANNVQTFNSDTCKFTTVCLSLVPINIAYKKVSGLDGAADYHWSTSLGKFSTGLNASYLLDVTMREANDRAPVDVLRYGTLGEAVRLKGGLDLGWEQGALGSNIYVSYMSGFTPFDTTVQKHLASFTTVNCSVHYGLLSGAVAQVGVNNIFNRMPPVDLQYAATQDIYYHQQFHNVDGASWYVNFKQPF